MRKLTKIERASYTVIITRDITESTLVEVRSRVAVAVFVIPALDTVARMTL
jgi:hypothetical protein